MKMLFVTDLYPVNNSETTTPRTLFDFVESFKKQGIEVDVIKPNFILNSFLRKKPFYKTSKYENVLNLNFWTPFLGDILQKKSISNHDYSVVVSHMPSGSIFAYKFARYFRLSLVAGVHVSDLEVLTKPLYSIYFKKELLRAFRYAKLLACRSFVIKDKLIKLYPEFENKVFVAASGVDEKIITKRDGVLENDRIKVLTCANFKKRKNIDKVIKACSSLENFDLTVIGAGTQRLEGISKNVKFTEHLAQNEVYEYMRKSDIFVLPSVGETFGMVYLEAMAAGCITICTKNDGVDGIIKNNENGFVVTPDIFEIKETLLNIKNMCDDEVKRICNNAYDTIMQYTKDKMAQNYLQQIFKIL